MSAGGNGRKGLVYLPGPHTELVVQVDRAGAALALAAVIAVALGAWWLAWWLAGRRRR